MENAIAAPNESSGLLQWLREMLKEEIAPYPGRSVMVARMVVAATITMIVVMTFRIPGGFQGALYAFLIARDDFRSTLKSGISIAVSYTIGVSFVLTCAALFASHPNARFLWFAGSMFVVFFALDTFQDYAIATGFAIILVLALPIWQTQATAEHRVELTLWQALACAVGTVVTIAVEAVFHSLLPRNELFLGLDDRLSAVQGLIDAYAEDRPVPEDVSKRLAKYTVVGVSGLRRILARSRYEQLSHDQLAGVIALTGRLIDLGASSASSPCNLLEGDRDRLKKFATQIEGLRRSFAESTGAGIQIVSTSRPSGIPLLPEMERTASLIPRVFAGAESVQAYFPSILDETEPADGFFKRDAFQNPAHIHFALRGCLAATLCYFTYEILNWRGIATSVTTCVLTALSNLGTSRQKQFLRISGAVVGGLVLGIGCQVFILPYLDTITGFSLLFAAITAFAAWFATSSQRLSYFGLQIANAFYLITVQEFTIQTSLATARDRVVGITLGLLMMWIAYHSFSKDSAAEHMVASFAANLRAIAQLALQPGPERPEIAMKRIRALRAEIGSNFQNVVGQSDAVPFEFGLKRPAGMANRALIKSWQPQLQTIYLEEIGLMQHRVFGAEDSLPPALQTAQRRFNEACASLLTQMADHVDGKLVDNWADLDAPLVELSRWVEEDSSNNERVAAASGLEQLSQRVHDLLTHLCEEIRRSEESHMHLTTDACVRDQTCGSALITSVGQLE
jgi:multidrug resistance protein MdtO